jgi:hypothetical protein
MFEPGVSSSSLLMVAAKSRMVKESGNFTVAPVT